MNAKIDVRTRDGSSVSMSETANDRNSQYEVKIYRKANEGDVQEEGCTTTMIAVEGRYSLVECKQTN